ncbi:hypothetical protein SK355_14010 [Candidatus Fukatsuia symbiotica]|uniref:Uncharacterized protein n=1 Tax=Candidatus Fukatsuia symbiotica TaxID=1878942 RepID=A0A2U8I4P4_9GAMM|nr:hypothetical protein [Candidatus Fukatsuia symbiotica]AWK14117.1 hypothetical protein CCS41_05910 [Candidatus Fukatsuia symbiotica]AWK14125.1 hypothetical protein CCS41_05955 [Candidatus Fukatsuia symbiotica]AWK14162.1 hypothetical protein CCS41_06185 [Candidatus Fukatsuia symbiotica]MEA9446263.1 hypothetical protein [Candidatus Fukatsuia symbiotica]
MTPETLIEARKIMNTFSDQDWHNINEQAEEWDKYFTFDHIAQLFKKLPHFDSEALALALDETEPDDLDEAFFSIFISKAKWMLAKERLYSGDDYDEVYYGE